MAAFSFAGTSDAVTLFGVPYAGGNSWAYRKLESHLPKAITLEGLELPGRGRRSDESLRTSLDDLAGDLFDQLRPRVPHGRYALLGHSMGALLAFLVAQRIQDAAQPPPDALFLLGSDPPSSLTARERHRLAQPEFFNMLRDMGGCPPEVLCDRGLLEFFEPVLRADFMAVETWPGSNGRPLDVPLTVMIGRDDDVSEANARLWARESTAPMRMHLFDGNHFFLLGEWARIGSIVETQLMRVDHAESQRAS